MDGDDEKRLYFVYGVFASFILLMTFHMGAYVERQDIVTYGGFNHWKQYKCEAQK